MFPTGRRRNSGRNTTRGSDRRPFAIHFRFTTRPVVRWQSEPLINLALNSSTPAAKCHWTCTRTQLNRLFAGGAVKILQKVGGVWAGIARYGVEHYEKTNPYP
jgi:hypothetical protein